ncbi:MAG: molybdopterin-synthase adenylyltransferase MoeB [Candidatus Latescibacteria bacterium]|nr:molybdopterin-synthase adenylyltransferase MoeB [Candidatus Latescibacterota bacterium]NIM21970.1 molybdopterin-synthase adenylyltransferase MoeB [Candidatus Latescibacterota bacterium]NIM65988.1 molybdopterin-synthase adenylyltransferase MoeB [Candidatus Latescibacterota bacterium]NIO02396.1 molybdopterin-synthase adenylyltransferase MoeB [Candidatus Latescibacterota bacterium]NIO29306.1 molybdopterin-synthase adenylyltransferase MoeB [Candidatus Latescibacterota bacterium]
MMLCHEEILRYSRHLILPEVALEGQLKLKAARVVLVGAGGLGSPLGLYLAAVGVGRIGLIDSDEVDLPNLQRQVMFETGEIGHPKCDVSRDRLRALNPEIEIVAHKTHLTNRNALDLLSGYDIIVDGSDNFPTRYLVNDACVLLRKPNVYGSVFRFEGQATVFSLEDGPCYRCLYPEPPPPGLAPSCSESGILGVLPGIIGTIQANETIKIILGVGESLKGRLLLFDALKIRFNELKLPKNPNCPVCGEQPTIKELIDYEAFCGAHGDETQLAVDVSEIAPAELKSKLEAGENILLLDVREPYESQISNLGGRKIPLGEFATRIHELEPTREIVVYCRTGVRSATAVDLLRNAGFRKVWKLKGGINAWAAEIDSDIPRY